MNSIKSYRKCTTSRVVKGRTTINCKLGLWTTNSLCSSRAEREAQRNYNQFAADGVYDLILMEV